jgi:hypothetical protein
MNNRGIYRQRRRGVPGTRGLLLCASTAVTVLLVAFSAPGAQAATPLAHCTRAGLEEAVDAGGSWDLSGFGDSFPSSAARLDTIPTSAHRIAKRTASEEPHGHD